MRYADDVYMIPDYSDYNSFDELNRRHGQLLHLHGTIVSYRGLIFELAVQSEERWFVCFTSDCMYALLNKTVDVYCTYEDYSESVRLPICSITKCGAIRTEDNHIYTSSAAHNDEDIDFTPKPVQAADESIAEDKAFNAAYIEQLRKNNATAQLTTIIEGIMALDDAALKSDTDTIAAAIQESVNEREEALIASVSDIFVKKQLTRAEADTFCKNLAHSLSRTSDLLRISDEKRYLVDTAFLALLGIYYEAVERCYEPAKVDYVEEKYSDTMVFPMGCFTLKVPAEWKHITQGRYEYFYGGEQGKTSGGFIYATTIIPKQFKKQDMSNYYKELISAMTKHDGIKFSGCRSDACEIAGQPGMRFSYRMDDSYISGFMLHAFGQTLVIQYLDADAETGDIDRMAAAILNSVLISAENADMNTAPVQNSRIMKPACLSPTGGREVIRFGRYPQNANGSVEPIEWLVLERRGAYALLLSRQALDALPYTNRNAPVTWKDAALRKWLNGEFLTAAFSEKETEALIVSSSVNKLERNPAWNTAAGQDTKDTVFLAQLSSGSQRLLSR